ncbi:Rieske 2Fe-2S domain-containing protein [Candidimonas nitroreducens]|uniref:Ring-hydroxylating oxygenase subunit alpha n=1 Tax=Candidimonas nitroreducens TaxID=683354 RepID=A0A225MQR5_9BURK|nr:Rieske 2Fe-2S domain-containing protein [Candidimonas nitroreducens]OWT63575.1 ring-hydroxylating oxygenase subunit alpha [Candidimonas nitroreducens]
MLKHEDNELLVRVGPKTAMGELMRLYWLPFLLSKDVPANGQPYRVRLLGEDLVAFRDSEGRVGLVDQACPHRGAPLVFARNEEGGLRCIYHGWKFSVDGRCHDMPAEPENTPMLNRVCVKAYSVRERNGVLWAYMGPDETPPELPAMEWNMVPPENVHVSMRIQECNWLQALEGEIDSAHAAMLHGRVDSGGSIDQWKQAADLAPKFEVVQHDAGLHIAARRKLDEDKSYVRVNQFLMPFWTLVPPFSQYPELSGHAWVPIDDEHTLCIMFSYHPAQPLYEKTRSLFEAGHGGRETGHASLNSFEPKPITHPYYNYWSKYNRENAYGYSPDLARKYNAGMPGLWLQDAACQSGVSPIYDRSKENLGVSDSGVARTRRMLLAAVKQLAAEGARPPSAGLQQKYLVRAISITIPKDGDWAAEGGEFMRAEPGKDFGYAP